MKNRRAKEKIELMENSVLSIRIVQCFLFVLLVVAFYFEKNTVALFLLLFLLLGILSRIIAKAATKDVNVSLKTNKNRLFPDDECTLEFDVANEKMLPVPWIDFSIETDYPACIDVGDKVEKSEDKDNKTCTFNISLGKVKGFEEGKYVTNLKASRRGICSFRNMKIKTGDFFSLVSANIKTKVSSIKEIVVYPRIVPVSIDFFTMYHWEGNHHEKGVLEDPTVIKLTRPYEGSDSMKSINWRLCARNQGIMVNQFEHIRPDKCFFIFDGQSFDGVVSHRKELEETLSIMASLIVELKEWGMDVGISMPKSKREKPYDIMPCDDSMYEVLFGLAKYDFLKPIFNAVKIDGEYAVQYEDSIFNDEILTSTFNETGRIYFITYDQLSADKSDFLSQFTEGVVKTLTYEDLVKMRL